MAAGERYSNGKPKDIVKHYELSSKKVSKILTMAEILTNPALLQGAKEIAQILHDIKAEFLPSDLIPTEKLYKEANKQLKDLTKMLSDIQSFTDTFESYDLEVDVPQAKKVIAFLKTATSDLDYIIDYLTLSTKHFEYTKELTSSDQLHTFQNMKQLEEFFA